MHPLNESNSVYFDREKFAHEKLNGIVERVYYAETVFPTMIGVRRTIGENVSWYYMNYNSADDARESFYRRASLANAIAERDAFFQRAACKG